MYNFPSIFFFLCGCFYSGAPNRPEITVCKYLGCLKGLVEIQLQKSVRDLCMAFKAQRHKFLVKSHDINGKMTNSCADTSVWVLLTQTVGQEVRGEALGAVAHRRVVVRVSSKHQHGAAHYDRRVKVAEEAAVSQNGPEQQYGDGGLDHS